MAAEMSITLDVGRLSVVFNTVIIQLECSDAYQAQVLFDDLAQRFKDGDKIIFQKGDGGK